MKSIWIAAVLMTFAGCKKTEDKKPNETQSAVTKRGVVKPLPGTESVQKLLDGVGTSAKPSSGTQLALGDILGKGGVLGGGPSLGAGVAGAPATKPVDPSSADPDDPKPTAQPAQPVALPPPAAAGGDCSAVAKRVADVMMAMGLAQLGDDAEARKQAEPMIRDIIAAMQPQVEQACKQQRWPQQLNDCILTAADATALQACEKHATAEMRAEAQTAAQNASPIARPTSPPPVWKGGNDCAAVGAHAAALAEWELSAAPPDLRASSADLIVQLKSGVEQMCSSGGWNDTVRGCVLAAASIDALNTCAATL